MNRGSTETEEQTFQVKTIREMILGLYLNRTVLKIFVITLSWRGRGENTRARCRKTLFRPSGAGYLHFFRCYDAHVVPILMDASYVWYPSRVRHLKFL